MDATDRGTVPSRSITHTVHTVGTHRVRSTCVHGGRYRMITDASFVGCANLPPEMASRLDQPWTFAGEVKTNARFHRCVCGKCSRKHISYKPNLNDYLAFMSEVVELRSYLFITDDMIRVRVYFGVCEACDSVFWARSGPPFRRARAMVPA